MKHFTFHLHCPVCLWTCCVTNWLCLSPIHLSDQLRPAHLLTVWLPVARLLVLPSQTAAEGKGGPRQTGSRTGDGGAEPHRGQRLQTTHQRPRCCGGLERLSRAKDRVTRRIYFCVCLLKWAPAIHSYTCFLFNFDIFNIFVFADAHFTHHKPYYVVKRVPTFCFWLKSSRVIWGQWSVIIICGCFIYFGFRSRVKLEWFKAIDFTHVQRHTLTQPAVRQTASITVLEILLCSFQRSSSPC